LVNRLLTPLSERILAHSGTIDKYIGDAIMAFWNAPLADPRHADHACQAALEMMASLDALNAEMAAEAADGEAPLVLRAGIGVNSGRCLAGNLGTHKRFNYSVLGDPVNVAARLEALTRTYDVDVILGEATVSALDGRYALLELDLLQVKGRQRPARIFALLGGATLADDQAFVAFASAHDQMIAAAHGDDPETARRLLVEHRAAAERFGVAGVYDLYATRLAADPEPARRRA
jgi:adenylate cyclase